MPVIRYPPWLERWWLNYVCQYLRAPGPLACLRTLEKEVERLSDLFTRARTPTFGRYGRDERLRLAYGLFFFPQTFVRIQFPLEEMVAFRGWRWPADRPVRILDLGAGLGAASTSVVTRLLAEGPTPGIHVTAVDTDAEELAVFRQMVHDLQTYWPDVVWTFHVGDLRKPTAWSVDEPWDLILVSFALGEAFFGKPLARVWNWLERVAAQLAPNGLLIITEPALRETSERLEQLRDRITERNRGLFIWGPCLHHDRCPLLKTGRFWCHEVRRWPVPESLRDLNRRLYRSIEVLKFSFLVVGRQPPRPVPPSPQWFRLVSPMTPMKGKFVGVGCASDGRRYTYEILTRTLTSSETGFLETLQRGDILWISSIRAEERTTSVRISSLEKVQWFAPS